MIFPVNSMKFSLFIIRPKAECVDWHWVEIRCLFGQTLSVIQCCKEGSNCGVGSQKLQKVTGPMVGVLEAKIEGRLDPTGKRQPAKEKKHLKRKPIDWVPWFKPLILAMWEEEIGRIMV